MKFLTDKFQTIILGSNSPRRKLILKEYLGIDNLLVIKSDFKEDLDKAQYTPEEYCLLTAEHKARDIISNKILNPESQMENLLGEDRSSLLITSDSIFIHDGVVYEKPQNIKEAKEWLMNRFRNSTITAFTGVVLTVCAGSPGSQTVYQCKDGFSTTVHLWDYPEQLVDDYLARYEQEVLDVSGGIVLSTHGSFLIKGFEGCFHNAAGFPVQGFLSMVLNNF
jgi:septum formation protein